MDPIYLQKQLRDNSSDLRNFCADLKQWGEEMKQKDDALKTENTMTKHNVPLVRNKIKKQSESEQFSSTETKRVKGIDYAAWDKFDVDAECAKVDEQQTEDGDSSDLTDECDETIREEAILHKEKGNKFVKKEKWDQAIESYTKAIGCYGYDPTFYSNRALCHLKKLDYRSAESDCTIAIQLDKTYVKAYYRRAQAREALNQVKEAHDDLLKVFDYEPENKEAKSALAKLEKKLESAVKEATVKESSTAQRPKSKFTMSRQHKIISENISQNVADRTKSPTTNITNKQSTSMTYWASGNNIEVINPITKAPHLCSKAPLRRIAIRDTDAITPTAQPLPSPTSNLSVIRCDDFKVIERKPETCSRITEAALPDTKCKKELTLENHTKESFCFNIPETSVQFSYDWKLLKNKPDWQYQYLKQVQPKRFKMIFNETLECDIFSGIIKTLAETFIDNNVPVYEYLMGLTEVKRFNMLVMFMTDKDKKALQNLIEYLRSDVSISAMNIIDISKRYDL